MSDRTVHGLTPSSEREIVRYDRAGKWYLESADGERTHTSVKHAAWFAAHGTHYPGLPGGLVFDARVRNFRRKATGAS